MSGATGVSYGTVASLDYELYERDSSEALEAIGRSSYRDSVGRSTGIPK